MDALRLLIALGAAGADDAAEALGARLVECAKLDDVPYLAAPPRALGAARADGAVRALVARDPAQYADPQDPRETGLLVTAMHAAGPEASDVTRALAGPRSTAKSAAGRPSRTCCARCGWPASTPPSGWLLDRDPVGQGRLDDPWEAAALLAELRAAWGRRCGPAAAGPRPGPLRQG